MYDLVKDVVIGTSLDQPLDKHEDVNGEVKDSEADRSEQAWPSGQLGPRHGVRRKLRTWVVLARTIS